MTATTRRIALFTAALACGAGHGCESGTVVLVELDARDTVRPVSSLAVEVRNGDDTVPATFALAGADQGYPVSFTVTPTGRTGELVLALDARGDTEAGDAVLARTRVTTAIESDEQVELAAILDPEDFVVNSSYPGAQSLVIVPGTNGKQVAVLPSGDDLPGGGFFATFVHENCGADENPCGPRGRLFGPNTAAVDNGVTSSSAEYSIAEVPPLGDIPELAVAASSQHLLVAWSTGDRVRGTLLNHAGSRAIDDLAISSITDVPRSRPQVAALGDGGFVVVWREQVGVDQFELKGRFLTADGTLVANPFPVSISSDRPYDAPIAVGTGSGRGFVVVWHNKINVYARFFDAGGIPTNTSEDLNLTGYDENNVTLTAYGAHVAWVGDLAMVAWGIRGPGFEDGALFLQRFETNGNPEGAALRVGAATGPEFGKPALAALPDGTVAVAWHNADTSGEGQGSEIYVQAAHSSALPIGGPIAANTVRSGDQTEPSIAALGSDGFFIAWNDSSNAVPDDAGGAVRARAVYPSIGVGNGEIGAPCGGGNRPCGEGLVCVGVTDTPYCHARCEIDDADACPLGGSCTDLGEQACIF